MVVPVLAAVAPFVDATVGDDAARMGQAGEPMNRVDLMDEPLIGNARGKRPEEAELEIFGGRRRPGGDG